MKTELNSEQRRHDFKLLRIATMKPKPMNKSDKARVEFIKQHGCQACRKRKLGWRLPDVHHVLRGGRRVSHQHTCGLCAWHHEGHQPDGMSQADCLDLFGPSRKRHPKEFAQEFGTEESLVSEINDRINEGSIIQLFSP